MKQESFKFSGRASNPATKKFSPAQIAAQKLFAERARAGTLGKTVKRNPVKANPTEKPIYFKTRKEAENVYLDYVDKNYPNKFQDAQSIARIQIREFDKGFAIQFGDYGPYLSKSQMMKTNPDKAKPRATVKRATKPKYNEAAVNKAIASSRSKISAAEAKTIHRLLKGRHGNPTAKKPLTLQERSKKFKIELGFDKFKTFKKVVGYYPSDSSPDYELVALFQTQREAVSAGRTYAENYPKFRWFVKDL